MVDGYCKENMYDVHWGDEDGRTDWLRELNGRDVEVVNKWVAQSTKVNPRFGVQDFGQDLMISFPIKTLTRKAV